MIWLIRFYQRVISPTKPRCCRFTPTCSQYALEAFTKRGFFVGLILTVCRILRCNPLFKGGYDPVPERGLRNPKPHTNDDDKPQKKKKHKGKLKDEPNPGSDL